MKLVFIHAPPDKKLSAKLTKWFTGSTAYHCGFVDEKDGTFFDMNLTPRKVPWPRYSAPAWVTEYEVPKLKRKHCEEFLKVDGAIRYSVADYLLFGLRPLYHLFGKSTRNATGMICSEMCASWLYRVGYVDALTQEVPSPAVLEAWADLNLK